MSTAAKGNQYNNFDTIIGGTGSLIGGTTTILNNRIRATDLVFCTPATLNGEFGIAANTGVGFANFFSLDGADARAFYYVIVRPL